MAKINYCFGYKITWFAIKGAEIDTILKKCPNLNNAAKTTWEDGLLEIEQSYTKAFLSGPYKGWTFLAGIGLCEPSQTEALIELLLKLGEIAEEVCYFTSHRTVDVYCFARVCQGEIIRLYCYSGEIGHIYKNIGERTEAEKKLLLSFATRDEDLYEEGFDEIDEDYILELAGQWSLDPESLIGEEEQENVIVEIA